MSARRSEYYQPGDVIFCGEPFMRVIHHDLWDKVCAYCLKKNVHLKSCGACGVMKYCGKNCQKLAWSNHKFECPLLPSYSNRRRQPMVQMIGNIILKIKGRDWKDVTERIMDKTVSFDDLVSHTNTKSRISLDLFCHDIEGPLKEYIGKENVPNKNELFEMIGKVVHNQFGLNGNCLSPDSWALFIGISKFDHSCVPNSIVVYDGKSLSIRAAKPIRKRLGKVLISYVPMITNLESSFMSMNMKKSFPEHCYCSDCSQPYGTSALTKIVDKQRAAEVLDESEATLSLVSLLERLKYPTGIVTRAKLRQLLEKQRGVLGNTNILRMRILAIRCLFMDGPKEEMRDDLMELVHSMIEVWGENYMELIPVYNKLIEVSAKLKDPFMVDLYMRKISRLNMVCFGRNIDREREAFEVFLRLLPILW